MADLAALLDPERIAVIGATDREGSVGRALMANLTTFDGEVLPVNPGRDTVFDTPAYESVAAIPDPAAVDLAVVIVPAGAVVDVVREAAEVGIGNFVVISAGFSERGTEGERRERDLVAVADEYDLALVGPNSLGICNTASGLNATFLGSMPSEGSISLMSQSGAVISAVFEWATAQGIGFKDVVSLGNEAVVGEVDCLEHWGRDPDTDVILAYLEDIEDGGEFVETAREVTTETPVVALKSGRTAAGAEAAASHTGSIAGSDVAYTAGFHAGGVLRAANLQEFFDMGRVFVGQPTLESEQVAVVTNGGGPGVLATDAIGDSALSMAALDPETRADLEAVLPSAAEATNPLDIIGDADLERFRRSLDIVLGDRNVGGAVAISVPNALFEFEDLATVIGDVQREHGKPVVACLMAGEANDAATARLREYGIPNYFDPTRAVGSLEALEAYGRIRDRPGDGATEFDVDRDRARAILRRAVDRGVDHLSVEAMDLLAAYGIPIPAGELATDAAEAERIAADIDGPVVMKVASPDILHKSDIGGVEIGVRYEDVAETYERIVQLARQYDAEATILGVQVEELVDLGDSTETIVGVNRDEQFGHLLMFGLGGIFVEIFEDTSFRVAPVTEREAREMTRDIQAAPMLRGARGREPADVDGVVEVIQRISQLVSDFPAIRELDVNPLVVGPSGVSAVDLRLSVDRTELEL